MSGTPTCRVFRTDPRSIDLREEHDRASFSAFHLPPSTVVVTVEGEVDATNSGALARYVERQVAGSSHLVIDLRLVTSSAPPASPPCTTSTSSAADTRRPGSSGAADRCVAFWRSAIRTASYRWRSRSQSSTTCTQARAIASSSLVGTTSTVIGELSVEIRRAPLRGLSLRCSSSSMPSAARPVSASRRTARRSRRPRR